MLQKSSEMFGKFTEHARKVIALANQEARRFNHEYIGTEHILLGLVKEGAGVAVAVLKSLGADLSRVSFEVEKIIKKGPDIVAPGQLPQTPRAKKVLEYALQEAYTIKHSCLGTEHLLLGLLREQDGIAAHVLTDLGITLENVRAQIHNLLAPASGNKEQSERKRIMISEKITKAFNSQLNAELYSAYLYLSMSASLASQNLPGFAAWMRVQTKEELEHAMKFYDHIIARGGKVQLTAIEPPPTTWDSPLAVAEHTCKHENKVTGLINDLVSLAKSEADTESVQFLQWFVDEQVEEEENVGGVLAKVKKAGDSADALQALDSELAKRGQ